MLVKTESKYVVRRLHRDGANWSALVDEAGNVIALACNAEFLATVNRAFGGETKELVWQIEPLADKL